MNVGDVLLPSSGCTSLKESDLSSFMDWKGEEEQCFTSVPHEQIRFLYFAFSTSYVPRPKDSFKRTWMAPLLQWRSSCMYVLHLVKEDTVSSCTSCTLHA